MSADLIWAMHERISLYDFKRIQGYCRAYPQASLTFRSTWRIGGLGNWLQILLVDKE